VFPELAPAPSRGGGSSKQPVRPIVSETSGGIMIDVPTYETVKDDDTGKETQEETGQVVQKQLGAYDRVINVPNSKSVTITVTPKIVELNPSLKGVRTINIKPDNLLRVRGESGYELIAQGTDIQDVERDGKKVATKSFKPYIPYEIVRGAVEGAYGGMTDVYEELEIGKKSQKKSTTPKLITVTIDGKTGQIDESQWSAFKKKYPKATRQ
jgi:hypothetical protein